MTENKESRLDALKGKMGAVGGGKVGLFFTKHKKLVTILVLVLIIGGALYSRFGGGTVETEITYTNQEVIITDIVQSISSSGTLQAANSYTVNTMVEGEVLECTFEEGDVVEKDFILYEIDSADTASNIEKAEMSLSQAQRNYETAVAKQYVSTDYSGTIYDMNVELGDLVTTGQTIATIKEDSTLNLVLTFPSDDAENFYVGQSATVTLAGTFEEVTGTVKKVSGLNEVTTGNMIVRQVTISVPNSGGLTDAISASATINGIGSSGSAYLSYPNTTTIVAEASGEVINIYADQGDTVYAGQNVIRIGGDDMEEDLLSAWESLRSTELTTESTQDSLDNYTITSPIDGTVIDKSVKVGDTVESGDNLCVIYDLSYLELTMSIDELDIQTISVGQEVSITADAMEDTVFTGIITKVSVVGTTFMGTTTYPVTVQLAYEDGLLPGMNVSAEIFISQSIDVMAVPNAVISRGNMVLVTEDSPSAVNALEDQDAPDGYVYVAVSFGLSDDNYTEILSGLTMEDTVASMTVVVTSTESGITMPGMDSGMSSGMSDPGMSSGMSSSGGMSGGRP